MGALETLFAKRLELAARQRTLGDKGVFDIAALQELIIITLNEARCNQKRFDSLMSNFNAILEALTRQRQTLQHVQVVNMEKPARDVRVTNLDEIPRTVRVEGLDIKFPEEVSVKKPGWYTDFSFERLSKELSCIVTALLNGVKKITQNTKVLNKKPEDAIPVRLVTPDGERFYKVDGSSYAVLGGGGGVDYGDSPSLITPVSVTDTGQDSYTLTTGKKTLAVQNDGGKVIAFGSDGLLYDDSPKLIPRQWYQFLGCPKNFKVYFRTATGETSKIVGFER